MYNSIKGFRNYLIYDDSRVYDKRKKRYIKFFISNSGYRYCMLYRDDDVRVFMARHRLVAMAHIPDARDLTGLQVNHKNGVKGDDYKDNLEWVTPRENLIHAGYAGLTSKFLPITVYDNNTNEFEHFDCIKDCARKYNLSKDVISHRVKSDGQRVFYDGRQYKLTSSDTPFKTVTDNEIAAAGRGKCKPIIVRYLEDNRTEIFNSLKETSIALGWKESTISVWLSRPDKIVLPGLIQIAYLGTHDKWTEFNDMYFELEKSTNKRCAVIVNNGDIKIYHSLVELAKELKILTTSLNYRLKNNCTIDNITYYYYRDFLLSPAYANM